MTSLPPMEVPRRLERLTAVLEEAGLDALVVSHLPNVRYLTGFTGSAGMLLVHAGGSVLVTDGRYRDQAGEQVAASGAVVDVAIGATAADQREILAASASGAARVGLEDHVVTWAEQRALSERLAPAELVAAGALVEDLRRSKDPGEVARIRLACSIADAALDAVRSRLASSPTESEFALGLEVEMRTRGASGVSFDAIVASGPNAAMPHARPTDRRIERGELVVIDFGCIVDGYCSDMTRTLSVGDPGPDARRLFETVMTANAAGREAVTVGVECRAVDAAARAVVDAEGLGDAFVHGTGHGVGVEIHEAPRLAATSRDTLIEGDVVTVEPGVYVTGVGGVRIEDTVVVTASGAEPLTCSPKDLLL
ncbi:MAG: Xaa-Pro peptidase family protein [Acidimicrobiia bacterium]|nr:Xaa-Pro peptidase family protein [Acidimicrobiia bacterium]